MVVLLMYRCCSWG